MKTLWVIFESGRSLRHTVDTFNDVEVNLRTISFTCTTCSKTVSLPKKRLGLLRVETPPPSPGTYPGYDVILTLAYGGEQELRLTTGEALKIQADGEPETLVLLETLDGEKIAFWRDNIACIQGTPKTFVISEEE